LFQTDAQVAGVCQQQGLSEPALLGMLVKRAEEQGSAVDLAMERARKLAEVSGEARTLPLHLLLSLVREPRSAVGSALAFAGLSSEQLTAAVWSVMGQKPPLEVAVGEAASPARIVRSRARQHVRFRSLALSEETEAKLQRTRAPAALPLLAAGAESALSPSGGEALGASLPVLTEARLRSGPRVPSARSARHKTVARARATRVTPPKIAEQTRVSEYVLNAERFPLLTSLGRNLTLLAATGDIDPVIGRERDIERLLDVVARRRGNNPLLIGAPGVGKTAIVEGLALALLAQPEPQRILLEISASSLLAGTGVRGALSERIQALCREVLQSAGRVLLFIDEIHCVLGNGEGDSLGNELKTALSRGELPVIGATTDTEYRRIFERDTALTRRFTRIEVAEPSQPDSVLILEALAPKYAAHHGVRYDDSALALAVELSVRYMPLRQLPDKALALIDQAGARSRRLGAQRVDDRAIAQIVSELAHVPVDRLLMSDREAMLGLERRLAGRVLGQSHATSRIGQALRKSAVGFRGQRPLGTFLFLGPTGVGKTEMAKAVSELLFPGIPLTRIDMSELGQAHSVARLLGAPPGYIGHEDGGQLTEAVRHRPYQLVLLDEIEKAHMSVLLALLPLLDEGRLTDGRGRTVDFTNTVIVMTSNLGAEGALARQRIGFGGEPTARASDEEARALSLVRAALPPELFNRIDEPLYFYPLEHAEVAEIARRMLADVSAVVFQKHGIRVEVDESAVTALLQAGGFDRQLGARPMRRTVGRLVEAPLAQALLAGEISRDRPVRLEGDGARIRIAGARVCS
jgi:ATP-dependent Clp protease ATP-binding subunit ClpC